MTTEPLTKSYRRGLLSLEGARKGGRISGLTDIYGLVWQPKPGVEGEPREAAQQVVAERRRENAERLLAAAGERAAAGGGALRARTQATDYMARHADRLMLGALPGESDSHLARTSGEFHPGRTGCSREPARAGLEAR